MLTRVFVFVCLLQLSFGAHIQHSLYDQDLSLPRNTQSCGDLRKQFENGYIRLKEFLDQIRNCKDSPHDRHKHHHLRHRTEKNHRKGDYSYTDYLVPVLRTIPDTSQTTNNDIKPTTSVLENHEFVSPAIHSFDNPTMSIKGKESSSYISPMPRPKQKTINGIVVDSAAGQLILKSLQNGELPGISSASTISNLETTNTDTLENSLLGNVAGNQRFSVLSPESNNNIEKSAPRLSEEPQVENHSDNWSEYFQYRHLLDNLGYDRNLVAQQKGLVENIDQNLIRNQLSSQVSNFFGQQTPTTNQFSPLLDANVPQLSNEYASPISRDFVESPKIISQNDQGMSESSSFTPTKTVAAELESINEELRDDVSLLHENTGGIRPSILTHFESFTPQILETIAARSKINGESITRKQAANNLGTAKRIFIEPTSNFGNNAAKDILDIKYTQLEDKLISDLKRRQAILQRLEQESMVQHFARPGSIPLSKLSDVFKSINDETAEKTLTRSQAQAVRKNQQENSRDDLGLFMPINGPKLTKRPNLLSNNVAAARRGVSSYDAIKYLEDHLPHNFALSKFGGKVLKQHKHDLQRFVNDQRASALLKKDKQESLSRLKVALRTNHKTRTGELKRKSNTTADSTRNVTAHNGTNSFKLDNNKNQNYNESGNIGNRRTNIPGQPDRRVPFSRNVLFTNKFFNDVIKAAMKRKSNLPNKIGPQSLYNRIQKKSTIYRPEDFSSRTERFHADALDKYNGNYRIW